jgi:SAM-dependent methyltransferase
LDREAATLMDRLTYTLEDQRRMSLATNYFAWQSRLVLPELGQRVLEIGCGIGNFTSQLLDREAVIALDIEQGCIEALNARYPDAKNLHTITADTSGDLTALKAFHPDSCVCLNVLEHIEDDSGTLRRIAEILQPDGIIVLILPAFPSLYGPIDRNLGHFRRYTPRSIQRLAKAAGLKIRKQRYLNMPGFFGWWVNARILRRHAQSEKQIEIFDRRIVPAISFLEDILPPPFGQSLFVVFEKVQSITYP